MDFYSKVEKFYEFEQEFNLLDLNYDGVYIWEYLRVDLFWEIVGLSSSIKEKKNISIKSKFYLLYNSIVYNPFFLSKKDRLVFLNPRKRTYDNKYIDSILYDFHKDNKSVNVIDSDKLYKTSFKRYDFIAVMMSIYRKLYNFSFSNEEIKYISKLETYIKEVFYVKFDLINIFYKYIKTFKSFYKIYTWLFKKLKPKEVFFIVNYGNAPLIKAAKDLNIKTIEVQHGIFDFFHPGYFYKYKKDIEYFPDKFLVWGDYFKNKEYLPNCEKEVTVISYMKNQYLKYKNVKEENIILVISDGGDNKGAMEKLLLNQKSIQDYKIIYKLHPHEYNNPQLFFYKDLKNRFSGKISFVKNEYDLYYLLKKSKYVITGRSTVVYEALAMNKSVFVLKVFGYQTFFELRDYVSFIDIHEQILNKKIKNIRIDGSFFIKSFENV